MGTSDGPDGPQQSDRKALTLVECQPYEARLTVRGCVARFARANRKREVERRGALNQWQTIDSYYVGCVDCQVGRERAETESEVDDG